MSLLARSLRGRLSLSAGSVAALLALVSATVVSLMGPMAVTADPQTKSVQLAAGYNFIALPLDSSSFTASTLLSSIGQPAKSISRFDAASQSYTTYDAELASFGVGQTDFVVGPNVGYIVYASQACSLVVQGTLPASRQIPLQKGYNLVGWTSATSPDVAAAFVDPSGGAVQSVSAFDGSSQQYVTYDVALAGFGVPQPNFQVSQGHAYFIFSSASRTLQYDDSTPSPITTTQTTTVLPAGAWKYRGSYLAPWGYRYDSPDALRSVQDLHDAGANIVKLQVFAYGNNDPSHISIANPNAEGQSTLIAAAKNLGTTVGVIVFIRGFPESGFDAPSWFADYKKVAVTVADFCEANGVDIFWILNEEPHITRGDRARPQPWGGLANNQYWHGIIAEVRKHFSGLLTYNMPAINGQGELQDTIDWTPWNDLDFISLEPYNGLWGGPFDSVHPTVEELKSAWYWSRNSWNIVDSYEQVYNYFKKPIFFGAFGYQNYQGTTYMPSRSWGNAGSPPRDDQEQANAFEAFFQTYKDKPWVMGCIIWSAWVTNPDWAVYPPNYTVVGKPAEQVVSYWWKALSG